MSSKFDAEWQAYLKAKPRLLAEGHAGKFVLFKGDAVVGIYDSREAAQRDGYRHFLRGGFVCTQIVEQEPVSFMPWNMAVDPIMAVPEKEG